MKGGRGYGGYGGYGGTNSMSLNIPINNLPHLIQRYLSRAIYYPVSDDCLGVDSREGFGGFVGEDWGVWIDLALG